jgi:hypothetical protein
MARQGSGLALIGGLVRPWCRHLVQDGPPGRPGPGGMGLGPPKSGSYVPPSMRNRGPGGGGEGDSMAQRRRDDNSIRVTNLSEDVTENDLQVRPWRAGSARCAQQRCCSSDARRWSAFHPGRG